MKRPFELRCNCGHDYHDHERKFDEKKQRFEFAHNGKCTKCKCSAFFAPIAKVKHDRKGVGGA